MQDVDLIDHVESEGVEVSYLGVVPEGGRFALARNRDGRLALWWIFENGPRRRRTKLAHISSELAAMIQAGSQLDGVLARKELWGDENGPRRARK